MNKEAILAKFDSLYGRLVEEATAGRSEEQADEIAKELEAEAAEDRKELEKLFA